MGVSPGRALPTATDTCRVRSVLPLPPQLQLLCFSATFAAPAVFGFWWNWGLGDLGLGETEGYGFGWKGPVFMIKS